LSCGNCYQKIGDSNSDNSERVLDFARHETLATSP
jgi:hypothetical protein